LTVPILSSYEHWFLYKSFTNCFTIILSLCISFAWRCKMYAYPCNIVFLVLVCLRKRNVCDLHCNERVPRMETTCTSSHTYHTCIALYWHVHTTMVKVKMKLCKAIFDWTSEELAIRGTFYDQFHMFTSGSLIVGVPSTFSTWIIERLAVTIHRTFSVSKCCKTRYKTLCPFLFCTFLYYVKHSVFFELRAI